MSKYCQNIDNLKNKKYIDNIIKVSKLTSLDNEYQEIVVNRRNQKESINSKINFDAVLNTKDNVKDLNSSLSRKHIYINRIKDNLIPEDLTESYITCINEYSVCYIIKLLKSNYNKSKYKNIYLVKKLPNNLLSLFFFKSFIKSKAFWFLIKNERENYDNYKELYQKVRRGKSVVNFSFLYCSSSSYRYQTEIIINSIYNKNNIITLKSKNEVDIDIKSKENCVYGISKEQDFNNKSRIYQVLKLENAKFIRLLNIKWLFSLLSKGDKKVELLNKFIVYKNIREGELWYILNLYIINNDLYSYILNNLKKLIKKDFNFTKNEIIKPKLLLFYKDKINYITNQGIFKVLENEWNDIKWFISFKFDTVFLNEHKDILINILKEKLDYKYFNLLMEILFSVEGPWKINLESMSRFNICENDKLSEFLINMFFCKLDKKVNELKYNFFGKYCNLLGLSILNLNNQNNNGYLTPDLSNKDKFNLKFIRYFDTFIIGINGSISDVNEIKEYLEYFLKFELKLKNISSFITDIHNNNLNFINVTISSGLCYNHKYKILFLFPKQLIIKALIKTGILNSKKIPICKKNLLKYDLNIIINTFIDINNFILSSFSNCHDYFKLNRFLSYYINCSLKLTIQAKLTKDKRKIIIIIPSIQLFRLGLITAKTFKKLYNFKVNNKKHLKRKYLNKNYLYKVNNFNWEGNVNFDFLISKDISF